MTTDPVLPLDLARELRDVTRRVSELERRNPLARASAHDGTRTRVEIGTVAHPATGDDDFGLVISDSGGRLVFAAGDEGIIAPAAEVGGTYNILNSDINSVTAASHQEQFGWRLTGWSGTVLRATFTCQTPASTEMKVKVTEVGGAETNEVTLPQNSNVNMQLRWDLTDESLYGWSGSSANEAIFAVSAYRSSGSGTCFVFRPTRVAVGSPTILTGNPSASALATS